MFYSQPFQQNQNGYSFYPYYLKTNYQFLPQNTCHHSKNCCHKHKIAIKNSNLYNEPPLFTKFFTKFFGKYSNTRNIGSKMHQTHTQEKYSQRHQHQRHFHENDILLNSNTFQNVLQNKDLDPKNDFYKKSLIKDQVIAKNDWTNISKQTSDEEYQNGYRLQNNARLGKYYTLSDMNYRRIDNHALHENYMDSNFRKSTSLKDIYTDNASSNQVEEKNYENMFQKNAFRTVKRVRFDKYYTVINRDENTDDFEPKQLNKVRRSISYNDLNYSNHKTSTGQKNTHLEDNRAFDQNNNEKKEFETIWNNHDNADDQAVLPHLINEKLDCKIHYEKRNKEFLDDLRESFHLFKLNLKKNLSKRLE
jgi:nicotinamide mononucleotide adenylyltransferase